MCAMGSADNFCLRWNDFESNISTSFKELREDKEFFDVTLCCDEGSSEIQAHKLILAACSPFFRKILTRISHPNPLIYLKGVDYANLAAILNFMYHGEVNVAQDELSAFLRVAEELAIKGLTDNKKEKTTKPESFKKSIKRPSSVAAQSKTPINSNNRKNGNNSSSVKKRKTERLSEANSLSFSPTLNKVEVKPDFDTPEMFQENQSGPSDGVFDESATAAEMDEELGYEMIGEEYMNSEVTQQEDDHITINSYTDDGMEIPEGGKDRKSEPLLAAMATSVDDFIIRSDNLFWCNVCHFNTKQRIIMIRHVEAKHFTRGYDCEICGEKLKTKQFLHRHKIKFHSK